MRRALLTARTASAAVSVGNDGTFGTLTTPSRSTIFDVSDPATADGTITSVKVQVWNAGSLYLMVGSLVSTNLTVRSVSGPHAVSVGLNTISVSLAVLTGDYIGATSSDGGRVASGANTGSTVRGITTSGSTPTPGTVYAITSSNADTRLSMLGTG